MTIQGRVFKAKAAHSIFNSSEVQTFDIKLNFVGNLYGKFLERRQSSSKIARDGCACSVMSADIVLFRIGLRHQLLLSNINLLIA